MTQTSNQHTIGRRKFLRTGCLTAAGVGVAACGGLGLAATYQPKIDLPATHYPEGDQTMTKKILIVYASKAGSTAEIAARIGQRIAKNNTAVDVLPVGKAGDLDGYSAVIVGSAIRTGSVLPEALAFIEKNQAALAQIPFHVFVACMTLNEDTEANRKTVSAYLDPVRALVKPASEGLFAGVMNLNKLPLFEKLLIRMMKAPQGDFRKWDLIDAWAGNLAAG